MRITMFNRTNSSIDLGGGIPKLTRNTTTVWDVSVLTLSQAAILHNQQAKRNIDYTSSDNPNEPDDLEVARTENVVTDAVDMNFVPAALANWDGATDPGNVNGGLDQLAARMAIVELGGGGIVDLNDMLTYGVGILNPGAGMEIREGSNDFFADTIPSLLLRTGEVDGTDSFIGLIAAKGSAGAQLIFDSGSHFSIAEGGGCSNPDAKDDIRFKIDKSTGAVSLPNDVEIGGVLTLLSTTLIAADVLFAFGAGTVSWQTADANSPYMLLQVPGSGGTGVLVGDTTAKNKDLGLFDAEVHPFLGVLGGNAVSATYLSNDNNDGYVKTTFGDLILAPFTGRVSIGTTLPQAPFHVGNRSVNNSVDCVVLVSRDVDDGTAGNGHCYSDSSRIDRSGVVAYNTVDARYSVIGTYDYNHFATFQALPQFGTTGTIDNVYGLISQDGVTAGTVTNRDGLRFKDFTGAGSVTNQAAVHVDELTKAGTNYAILTEGSTPSQFGGPVSVGGLTVDDGFASHRQVTTVEKNGLTPRNGAHVHDTDLDEIWVYLGAAWRKAY